MASICISSQFHERHLFGYYSLWLVVYKARMDIVLPACCTFQSTSLMRYSQEILKNINHNYDDWNSIYEQEM